MRRSAASIPLIGRDSKSGKTRSRIGTDEWRYQFCVPKHKRRVPEGARRLVVDNIERGIYFVLCRPGSDLLSQGLSHSTIGAEEFNGRVRDGIGFKLLARTTRPAKDKDTKQAERLERSRTLMKRPRSCA